MKTDHHKDFSKKFSTEQLQHAVQDVLPTVVQDVTVAVCQSKHGPRCQLRLRVVAERDWNVFNRLSTPINRFIWLVNVSY